MKSLGCLLLFCSVLLVAQEEQRYPTFDFKGILKNKFEWSPDTGRSRFDVRNSRLGLIGKIFPNFDYVAKLELSDEGKFKVLDLYGSVSPVDNLSVRLGQFGLPIFNSYTTNPGTMMFANRTFLAKYFMGSRDIGLMGIYKFDTEKIPMSVELGVFNGDSSNNPVWSEKISYAGRFTLGDLIGWRTTAKFYDSYKSIEEDDYHHIFIYGADLRYGKENWKVETEFMHRENYTLNNKRMAAYLQAAYAFSLDEKGIIKSIMPAARYDFVDENNNEGDFDVSRVSVGLGFGISEKPFHSLIRLDYEWYFVNNELEIFNKTEEMDANKFTLELVYIF